MMLDLQRIPMKQYPMLCGFGLHHRLYAIRSPGSGSFSFAKWQPSSSPRAAHKITNSMLYGSSQLKTKAERPKPKVTNYFVTSLHLDEAP